MDSPASRADAFELAPQPILAFDAGGALVFMNEAARSLFAGSEDPRIADLVAIEPGEERELEFPGPGQGTGIPTRYAARFFDPPPGGTFGRIVGLSDISRVAGLERALSESAARLSAEQEHRVRVERQMTRDALRDPLTGLANRSLLLNRVEQAIARARRDGNASFCLFFIDFDGFEAVNDSRGREAGDAFLRESAARLRKSLRDVDLVARLGGDEFVVLLECQGGAMNVDEIADRIAEEISAPMNVGGGTVVPSASIGLLRGGANYTSADEAVRDADIAMRLAKAQGRNCRVTFQDSMRREASDRNLMKDELRAAIASGGIALAFQPIVSLDGQVTGWEILARWRSSRGPIGPDRFIPLAEETGLIVPLGTFVFLETLRVAASLISEGLIGRNGRPMPFFAINVSPIQLLQPDFADLILSSIERSGVSKSLIHLEITESSIMENREATNAALHKLASGGVRFKLDDFGTGYSSLAYLHRLPIDTIKIDRCFIEKVDAVGDSNSAGLVRGIVTMGHAMGKSIVAEGIETEAQAEALRSFGCDFGQGYLFGRPMDRDSFQASLRAARGA
jgi:diguanylate cyclase (GGDEF)-like protein